MKNFFVFILFLFSLLPQLQISSASAQTPPVSSEMITMQTNATANNYTITSTVEISNKSPKSLVNATLLTKLLSEGKEKLVEGNGARITVKEGEQLIAFSKSKPLSLTSSQNVSQETTLVYPSTIKPGNYTIVTELLNENGISQGFTTTEIKLSGTDGFLDIELKDCTIKVGENIFSIVEGPVVGKNDKGEFTCEVQNNTSSIITAKPKIVFAVNSVTQASKNAGEASLAPITIGPGKKVPVTIAIPKNLSPQVYEGLFSLVDYNNSIISPAISFRWIIPGASATIQHVALDAAFYPAGSAAKVSITALPSPDLSWQGPANTNNPGFSPTVGTHLKSPTLSVKILSEEKQLCGQKDQSLPSTRQDIYWDTQNVSIPISINCESPQVRVEIVEKGIEKPLASAIYTTVTLPQDIKKAEEQKGDLKKNTPTDIASGNIFPIVIGILVLLIISIAGFVLWKRRKNKSLPSVKPPVALFFAVTVAGVLGMYVGGVSFQNETIAQAQQQYAPFQGVVKQANNSTDANTETLTFKRFYQRIPPAHDPPTGGNVRDFAQNNTGGDSQVSVDSTCRTIQITLKGNAVSQYMCGNWGPGIAVANFVDNAPITPTNVASPVGNHIKFPGLQIADSAFNPNSKALYGPNTFALYNFGTAGARNATYTLTLPQPMAAGNHTLLVQIAASLATSHSGHPDNVDRFYSSFEPATLSGEHNCGGNQPCFINLTYRFQCGPPACGNQCTKDDECAGARNGCTACVPNDAGQKVCAPPPACNAGCTRDDQCAGARDGCTACVPNDAGQKVCAPPPACGTTCVRDDQCAGARDGCTACVPNNAGTGKVCSPPPACGTACVRDDQCAGARNGCNLCNSEGKCSAFSPDMCSCDGIDFIAKKAGETFFPGDNVTFVAFGKVPGKDWKGTAASALAAAEIKSIQLALYQSKASDPNNAVRIAQSAAITPVIVENTAAKVRYKVTWDQKIPPTPPPGTIYRVQATLKCSPKAGVLGAKTVVPGKSNYFTQLYTAVEALFARGSVLADSVTPTPQERDQQQLEAFSPAAQILEKSCTILRFSFD